ncbi:MAG: hypothetical protein JRG91_14970 [Deltaproteobacteria bacterium]|nr:hypothetical protein [Deltaproteobacteria bacterium]
MNARAILATAACTLLIGCASAGLLQSATADEVGGKPDDVKISERFRIVDEVRWKAKVGELEYACESLCANKKCDELDPVATVCEDLTFSELH